MCPLLSSHTSHKQRLPSGHPRREGERATSEGRTAFVTAAALLAAQQRLTLSNRLEKKEAEKEPKSAQTATRADGKNLRMDQPAPQRGQNTRKEERKIKIKDINERGRGHNNQRLQSLERGPRG